MADKPDDDENLIPGEGVVLRARNGDVIRYDDSGLVMRLSDRVIADIALRMGSETHDTDATEKETPHEADPALLDEIDAWDIRQEGDWLRFTARRPDPEGVRGYRRHVDDGAILGDGPGPLLGLLGLGGPRAALASMRVSAFPSHVLAPEDDIGAVGHAGIGRAAETNRLEPLRECTHEALAAETILRWQVEKFAPLPLIVTRVETDPAANAADLATGVAIDNLITAARNLKSAAERMGKTAKVLAICLDYALEDVSGDATAYRDGMLAVMKRVEDALWSLGYDKPLFVSRFEAGLSPEAASAVLEGQWELSWNHGDHRLIHSAPSYAFPLDRFHRPTEEGRTQMAEMTAAALSAGVEWRCPALFLAEWEPGNAPVIRVTAQAETDLVMSDGPHGFSLLDTGGTVTDVGIAPDDPQALLIRCSTRPDGAFRLAYAAGQPGALRDTWSMPSVTGATLHRWALPAILPVREGRHA